MSMEKEQIEEYIKQLMSLEENIKNSESDLEFDSSISDDLDNILSSLSSDIQKEYGTNSLILPVKIKKLNSKSVIPTYSKNGDAGLDLTITEIINENKYDITYGFGIALEIPNGYVGLIFPRSSVRKYDLLLTNSVGVIDSGYRGEIQATFKKLNGSHKYNIGERGAQILILPYPKIQFIESESLSESERNDGGFGSTGN